jgi:hypothetical protein
MQLRADGARLVPSLPIGLSTAMLSAEAEFQAWLEIRRGMISLTATYFILVAGAIVAAIFFLNPIVGKFVPHSRRGAAYREKCGITRCF